MGEKHQRAIKSKYYPVKESKDTQLRALLDSMLVWYFVEGIQTCSNSHLHFFPEAHVTIVTYFAAIKYSLSISLTHKGFKRMFPDQNLKILSIWMP